MNARAVAVAALAGLALLQPLWHALLAPPARLDRNVVTALALAPLLACLLLAWKHRRRGLLWGGVVALPYFCHGVMEAWAAPAVRALALVEVALTLALIAAVGAAAVIEKRRP
jgi:uncharacterized membrane protein